MLYVVIAIALIAAFLIHVANRPSAFAVRRDIAIAAPAARIYPLIADFHRWAAWSPYEKRDPAMTKTYSGAQDGVGAVYEWSGNGQVGVGRMTLTEAEAPSKVVLELHMLKPMEGRNTVTFTLEPEGGATRVI